MYSKTLCTRGLFSRAPRIDMQSVLERHFWSLTHYRIGSRFLALDYAGNVIRYSAYRSKSFGGWTAVTLGAPGTPPSAFLSSDLSTVNVLEDGHPMHYRARQKLQEFVAEERRRWQARRAKEEAARAAAAVAKAQSMHLSSAPTATSDAARSSPSSSSSSSSSAAQGSGYNMDIPEDAAAAAAAGYDSEQQFRDLLAITISHPRFFTRHLRVSRTATLAYKMFYFYLWALLVSLIVQGYLLFRSWVNPPARAGLRNLEEYVLHIPRLLFAGCVYGLAAVVRAAQPVLDPIVGFLGERFPQINWHAASAERLAAKAEHIADDARPEAAKARREALAKAVVKQESVQTQGSWYTRVLLVLLAIFSVLCVM